MASPRPELENWWRSPDGVVRKGWYLARRGAEAQRRAVDEPELAALAVGHRAGLAILQRIRYEQDRRERRADVVRQLHDEVLPVGARETGREVVRLGVRLGRPRGAGR